MAVATANSLSYGSTWRSVIRAVVQLKYGFVDERLNHSSDLMARPRLANGSPTEIKGNGRRGSRPSIGIM